MNQSKYLLAALTIISIGAPQSMAAQNQSLFSGSQVPAEVNISDGAKVNYELGTRFSSSAAGKIIALRFYKASKESNVNNQSTHTGKIYSAKGVLLASVVFKNETASGWQEQALPSPLSISANVKYVVSVNTGSTYYVDTISGFASPLSSGVLTAPVGAGVFGPVGKMPKSVYKNSDYFRDIVFIENPAVTPSPDPAPIPAPAPAPTPAPVVVSGVPPLAWNDPMFVSNKAYTAGNEIDIQDGGAVSGIDIVGSPVQTASALCYGACKIDHVRISSNEGIRVGGSGAVSVSNTYIATTALPGDHADGLQAYAPNDSGSLTLTNVTFQSHAGDNSGIFIADGWVGPITMNNVLFLGDGGNRAFDIYPDAGDIHVSFNNVYFVGPWLYGQFDMKSTYGHNVIIDHWNNVVNASIVNGALVPGAAIPCPSGNGVICSGN